MRCRIFAFVLVFFAAACRLGGSDDMMCPRVVIPRDTAYLTQIVNYREKFQISLVGYEGHCYFDTRVNRDKAVINPVFKIKRLRRSDETDVHFAYYTETVKGPPAYLGKKTYYMAVAVPADETETTYTAPSIEVKIPPEMKYEFDINLGLVISPEEAKYNRRTFDVDYRYVDE